MDVEGPSSISPARIAGLASLIALALAAAAAWWWIDGPPATGEIEPPAAVEPPVTIAAAIRAVTTGLDRARIHFGAPIAVTSTYELVEVGTGKSVQLRVPAGSSTFLASGLSSDRPYLARPLARPDLALPFRTRRPAMAKGGIQLFPPTGATATPDSPAMTNRDRGASDTPPGIVTLAREGKSVYLLAGFNRTKGCRVQFLESPDEGETWFEEVVLAPGQRHVSGVYLGLVRGGLLAAWHGEPIPPHRRELSSAWRAPGSATFSAPVPLLVSSRAPAMILSADGVLRGVAVSGVTGLEQMRYVECDAIAGKELLTATGPKFDSGGSGLSEHRLVETATGVVWIGRAKEAMKGVKHAWLSRAVRPELGLWEPLRPLLGRERDVGMVDAMVAPGMLVVAHEARGGLEVMTSRDGGGSFTPGRLDPQPGWLCCIPGLTTSGSKLLLAFHDSGMNEFETLKPGRVPSIHLFSSTDGLLWKASDSRRALLTSGRSLGVVAGESTVCVVLYDEIEGLITLRLAF